MSFVSDVPPIPVAGISKPAAPRPAASRPGGAPPAGSKPPAGAGGPGVTPAAPRKPAPAPVGRRRRWTGLPGAWTAAAAFITLGLLALAAPGAPLSARALSLAPALRAFHLLTTAAALGAIGMLSAIRHLWSGEPLTPGALGLALNAAPLLLAGGLLLARFLLFIP